MKALPLLGFIALLLITSTTEALPEEQSMSAPIGARLLLEVEAQGVQIYNCEKSSKGDHWVFAAPEAALFDVTGRQIGTHFAGPTWQLDDGSKVVGELVAQAPAPEPHAIAWLLLRAKSHEGNGALNDVSVIRRINTAGGTLSGACSAGPARMRYTARYQFYAAPQ